MLCHCIKGVWLSQMFVCTYIHINYFLFFAGTYTIRGGESRGAEGSVPHNNITTH